MTGENLLDAEEIARLDVWYAEVRKACGHMDPPVPWDDRTRRTLGLLAINLHATIGVALHEGVSDRGIVRAIATACYYTSREGIPPEER